MDLYRSHDYYQARVVGVETRIVQVSEADPQTVKAGVQIMVETNRRQEQVTADWTHTNIFGDLTRFNLRVVAGWAEMPSFWQPFAHGPVVLPRAGRAGPPGRRIARAGLYLDPRRR